MTRQVQRLLSGIGGEPTLEDMAAAFPHRLDKVQRKAIQMFLDGASVVVCAPTGAGKTAIAEAAAIAVLARCREFRVQGLRVGGARAHRRRQALRSRRLPRSPCWPGTLGFLSLYERPSTTSMRLKFACEGNRHLLAGMLLKPLQRGLECPAAAEGA